MGDRFPTPQELAEARERFRELLERKTDEPVWQQFFATHPYVLSRALPLRLDPTEIIPLATPGTSEPDFIFYQRDNTRMTSYGAIELKRPDSTILTVPRRNVIQLSRDAATAIQQAQIYARGMSERFTAYPSDLFCLGGDRHIFVVMGLAQELNLKGSERTLRLQLSELLPPGCHILPYDEVLRRFESSLPERPLVLVPPHSTFRSMLGDRTLWSLLTNQFFQETNLDRLCTMFVNMLVEHTSYSRAILTLCEEFRGYAWYFAGLAAEEIEVFHRNKMTQRERITIFQEQFRLGGSYYIPHTQGWDYEGVRSQRSQTNEHGWHPDDFLFIPLIGRQKKLVGVVSLDDPRDGAQPTATALGPVEVFANRVAHAIQDARERG